MTAPRRGLSADYADSVFVNCPFDAKYRPLFLAILFAVHDCGFVARHALQGVGGRESRLDKIVRLIRSSRLSIHDVSRVEPSRGSRLPRFNMPFECGVAYGATAFDDAKREKVPSLRRDLLVMAAVKFQDKATISDLAGIDPGYHANEPAQAVRCVRRFLQAQRGPRQHGALRSHGDISKRLTRFRAELPVALKKKALTVTQLESDDYVNDWLQLAVAWIAQHPA
jgi:hypothetical protein